MRLIDADELLKADFQDFSNTDVFNAINNAPTVCLDGLQARLSIAENVCRAAERYVKYGSSPVATGWDDMLKALREWREAKQEGKEVEE